MEVEVTKAVNNERQRFNEIEKVKKSRLKDTGTSPMSPPRVPTPEAEPEEVVRTPEGEVYVYKHPAVYARDLSGDER